MIHVFHHSTTAEQIQACHAFLHIRANIAGTSYHKVACMVCMTHTIAVGGSCGSSADNLLVATSTMQSDALCLGCTAIHADDQHGRSTGSAESKMRNDGWGLFRVAWVYHKLALNHQALKRQVWWEWKDASNIFFRMYLIWPHTYIWSWPQPGSKKKVKKRRGFGPSQNFGGIYANWGK